MGWLSRNYYGSPKEDIHSSACSAPPACVELCRSCAASGSWLVGWSPIIAGRMRFLSVVFPSITQVRAVGLLRAGTPGLKLLCPVEACPGSSSLPSLTTPKTV